MRFDLPESPEGQTIVVAYLRAHVGLTVREIADATIKSEATINRRLKDAESRGMIKQYVFTATEELRKIYGPYLRDCKLEKDIIKKAGESALQSAIVVPSGSDAIENRNKVAKVAGGRIMEKVRNAVSKDRKPKIGISYGRTLKSVVDSIVDMRRIEDVLSAEKKRQTDEIGFSNVEVLPLCGDFWFQKGEMRDIYSYSSNRLATDLAASLGSRPPIEMSMPAYLPARMAKEPELSVIKDFLSFSPAMKYLYEGEQPLIRRLDGLITSCGYFPKDILQDKEGSPSDSLSTTTLIFLSELVPESTYAQMENAGVIGDVLGIFISEERSKIVDRINSLFLGPKQKDFRAIAESARKDPIHIGVIIVAAGEEKSEILLEIVRLRFANEIIVDSALSDALMKRLS